jgi:hypothetical protein
MKILAIEKEVPGVQTHQYAPHLKREAMEVWKLNMEGILREAYFTSEGEAVLILECQDRLKAMEALSRLPLVREKLIAFTLLELRPYDGFARLFAGEQT